MIDWVPNNRRDPNSTRALQEEGCQAHQPDFMMADVRNTGCESTVKEGNALILV